MSLSSLREKVRRYLKILGPGLVTGAADDDPAGIATYSQAGALYGFQLLWLSFFTFPLMSVIQEMCARIGLATGRGLAANIRREYPRVVLYACVALLVAANTLNISADIGAMAEAVQLLVPADFLLLVIIICVISLVLEVFTTYTAYARYLKYLTIVLFGYVITAFLVDLNWHEVFRNTIAPSITFSKDQIIIVCAILGTTISPYLFFWQSSQEIEEEIQEGKTSIKKRQHVDETTVHNMRLDVWFGMLVSNAVMFFIIAVCAGTLFVNGVTDIRSAADAAEALRPFAGRWSEALFAIGIIGTGLLAIPVLAGSSAYAVAETFHWKEGLYKKWWQAYGFYGVIGLSFAVALVLNAIGIDPIRALIYSAVGNGLVAPVMLFFIVHLSGSKHVMGTHTNHPVISAVGWFATVAMSVAGIATIVALFL